MNNTWYKVQGSYLALPEDYRVDMLPDWRAVLFSVIIPATDVTAREGFAWPDGWIPGRYRGLKKVQIAGESEAGSGFERRTWKRKNGTVGGDDYHFTPRVFHQGASSYFREPLRSSVGAAAADASPKGDAAPGEWFSGNQRNPTSVHARRYLFEPDLTREEKIDPPECDAMPATPQAQYKVGAGDAVLRLLCAEYLTYSGPALYSDNLTKADTADDHFLVLHVAAENCSSDELEGISGSLTKPRDMVTLRPHDGEKWSDAEHNLLSEATKPNYDGEVNDQDACANLLELFVRTTEHALLPGVEPQEEWKVGRGGFLRVPKSTSQTKPYTVSVAMPGGDLETPPSPFKEAELNQWSAHDLWAWYLAVRFDQYNTDIPDLDAASLEYSKVARTQQWTLHSAEGGLSVVRRNPLDLSGNGFMMLAPTRFVDLAILVRRAENYLLAMGKQLRAMRFDSAQLDQVRVSTNAGDEVSSEQLREAQESLQTALDNFSKIQIELVYLRDHLWYEGVSGREMATEVLQHMLTHTGTRRTFNDLNQEVELRKDVYTTRAQSYRISINALEAKREKAEEERRRQAAELEEQREKEQQRQQDRTNLVLGIVALCFAIPGVFQLMPGDLTWGRFWLCVVVVIAASLGLVWFLLAEKSPYQRWKNKSPG